MKNYRPIVEIEDIIQSKTSRGNADSNDSLSFIKNAFISQINEKDKPNSLLVQNGRVTVRGNRVGRGVLRWKGETVEIPPEGSASL